MPVNPLTVSQVAAQLQLSPATVRRYGQEFPDHLSPGATPPPGTSRKYTPEDVAILRAARDLLASGETYTDVNRLLDTVAIDATPDPIPTAAPGVDLAPLQNAVTTVFNRLDTLDQDLQTALSDRLSDRQTLLQLAADVDKVREDRTRPLINLFWFGAGFALALVALYLFSAFIR
jgi:DNA-binding transcriptional MerR regulator